MSFAFICKWELRLGYKTQASVTQGGGRQRRTCLSWIWKSAIFYPSTPTPPLCIFAPLNTSPSLVCRASSGLHSAPLLFLPRPCTLSIPWSHPSVSLHAPLASSFPPPPPTAIPDWLSSVLLPISNEASRWVHVNCLQKWQLFPALTEALSIETRFQEKGRNLALICCSLLSCESSWYLAGHSKKIS